MPIDTTVPRSPGWWLAKLEDKLRARRRGAGWSPSIRYRRDRRPGLDLLDDYLRGDPPLPDVAQGWSDVYVPLIREARMNYAELVVSSASDRMIPVGWTTAVDNDESGDEIATRISVANQLPLKFSEALRWMLSMADGYMIAGPPSEALAGMPVITAEDPRECITEDNGHGLPMAALKLFRDPLTDDELAYLYLPGNLWVARRGVGAGWGASQGWEWDADLSGAYPPGFEDLVPVVRFRNRDGRGEYETHLSLLDRINSEIFRRVTVSLFQAHRQRAVIGLPDTTDGKDPRPDGGNVIDYTGVFDATPDSIWQLPFGAQMWESGAVSLDGIRAAIKDDVQQLAAVTRTALYSVVPDAANGSAEGAALAREGQTYRIRDRQTLVEAPLARLMAMCFRYLGEADRADVLAIRTLWQPIERHSLADMGSAAAQAKAAGLPVSLIWRDIWQYPPEEIPRIERAATADLQREAERATLLAEAQPAPAPAPVAAPAPNVPTPVV